MPTARKDSSGDASLSWVIEFRRQSGNAFVFGRIVRRLHTKLKQYGAATTADTNTASLIGPLDLSIVRADPSWDTNVATILLEMVSSRDLASMVESLRMLSRMLQSLSHPTLRDDMLVAVSECSDHCDTNPTYQWLLTVLVNSY